MKTRPLMYCTVVAVFVSILFIVLHLFSPEQKFYHPLLHSSIEGVGVVLAFNIFLLLFLYDRRRNRAALTLIQSAFVCMGTIAVGHFFIVDDQTLILLHSSATFAGGLLFALIWLPVRVIKAKVFTLLPFYVFIFSFAFLIGVFQYSDTLVPRFVQARLDGYSCLMNFSGGGLFLVAAVKFSGDYLNYKRRFEDVLFAYLSLLLGIAALLFLFGRIWSWGWWEGHWLRLFVFFSVLFFLSVRFSLLQNKAREDVERYRNLVDNLPDIFYIFSNQRGGLFHSRRVEDILGYSRKEFLVNPFFWRDSIHPDDLPGVDAAVTAYKRGGINQVEYRIRDKEGKWHWFSDRFVRESRQSGEIVVEGLATDITEKKEAERELRRSEKRFRESLDQLLEGCQIIGHDWRYLYMNDAAARHGRRPKEEYLDRKMMDLYPGIEDTEMFAALRDVMSGGVPRHLENEFIYPDGTSRWFELSIQSINRGLFVLSIDITARKHAEAELLQYGETQAVLLREVNHRVKNNLAVLIGMLRKEHDRALQRGVSDYLPILNDLISRLLGLAAVHSLLSASSWQPIFLNQLCRTMIMEGLMAQQKEIQYDITPSDVKVESSQAHHLALILNELFTNSTKYAVVEHKKLFISISIQEMEKEIGLTYRDNGPGYSDEIINGDLSASGIGFDLICGITNRSLGGSVSFRNENGAVAELIFPVYETS